MLHLGLVDGWEVPRNVCAVGRLGEEDSDLLELGVSR